MSKRNHRKLIVENNELYQYYYERLLTVALSQFEWHGDIFTSGECDRRYLEWCLLFRGYAAIYKPEGEDFWVSTGAFPIPKGRVRYKVDPTLLESYISEEDPTDNRWEQLFEQQVYNIYGNPSYIRGIGYNGNQIKVDPDHWDGCYDNQMRLPITWYIQFYAKVLYEVHQTYRGNLKWLNQPLFVTSRDKATQFSIENLMKQRDDFEPNIPLIGGVIDPEQDFKTIPNQVNFHGTELTENLKFWWNQALSMLGIATESTKKERLLDDEISLNRQEDAVMANSRLLNRVEFCNRLNKKHGLNISVNLSVQDTDLPIIPELSSSKIINDAEEGDDVNG